jgi:hypothetical protein
MIQRVKILLIQIHPFFAGEKLLCDEDAFSMENKFFSISQNIELKIG